MEKGVKRITLGLVLSWIFSVIFGLAGINIMLNVSFGAGLPLILAALILLPPVNNSIQQRFNIKLSRGLKITLVIILFFVYAFSFSNNDSVIDNAEQKVAGQKAKTESSPAKGTMQNPYKFDERVIVGDFAYNFHSMSKAYELGERVLGEFYGEKADGMFVIIDVTIENVGKESKHIWSSNVKIIDDQGRTYDHDTSAEIYLPDNDAFTFEQMQPGLPKKGNIVFDVPEDLVGAIEISSDSIWSGDKKYVSFS